MSTGWHDLTYSSPTNQLKLNFHQGFGQPISPFPLGTQSDMLMSGNVHDNPRLMCIYNYLYITPIHVYTCMYSFENMLHIFSI